MIMSKKQLFALLNIALAALILIIYSELSHFDFSHFDDQVYVTDNVHVRGGLSLSSVKWAFLSTEAGFWHPLTWLSLMLDYELFRLNAGGYHWTNVLIHLLSALLLFMTFYRMTGALYRSWIVAVLFALHPLHVEPVAWVAARKDVLSGLFWMLSMWFYVRYVAQPGVGRYIWVALFFLMGLMSKPMVVTLPFVLLLLDYWPLGRYGTVSLRRLIGEKIPLLIMVIPIIWLTLLAEGQAGALKGVDAFSLWARVSNAAVTYVVYLIQMFFPLNLAVYYPHPGERSLWQFASSVVLLFSVTIISGHYLQRFPYLLVGWLWYLGTLIPVSGLLQVGSHAMADRYTYLPLIGLFIMMAWGSENVLSKRPRLRPCILAVISIWLSFIIFQAKIQVQLWQNAFVLFDHAVKITKNNYLALNNLGAALAREQRYGEAMGYYRQSLDIKPDYYDARYNLGSALSETGYLDEALQEFKKAYFTGGKAAALQNNLGTVYARKGDYDKAIFHFLEALHSNPDYDLARRNLDMAIKMKEHAENP